MLTLLTYADISAVNPTAMTPWRAEQFWQLYLLVYNELTRELETERIEAVPAGSPERIAFLEGFPTRYLRTHSEAEIDEHLALEADEPQARRGGGCPQAGIGAGSSRWSRTTARSCSPRWPERSPASA